MVSLGLIRDRTVTGIDGYVDDEIYPSGFDRHFAPAWTDAVLLASGRRPPRAPRGRFTYLDLGCGDGVGLILLAAAHPEASFVGIDALPAHIAQGRALAAAIGLPNISFRCATFAQVDEMAGLSADYVALRGVVTWVSRDAAATALDIAARLLRPGGALVVGYNVLPGWSPLIAFQRLVFDRAATLPGTGAERFTAAVVQLREAGLVASPVLAWLDDKSQLLPPGYFAHEYLNRHWAPIWSGDLIDALSARALDFAASASAAGHRADFHLRKAQREALAGTSTLAEREIATDIFLNACFRTDVFVKSGGAVATPDDRLGQVWARPLPASAVAFETHTKMGRIRFDNAAARAILGHLDAGADRLDRIAGVDAADLLNTLDALWLAGLVVPAEPAAAVPLARSTDRAVTAMTAAMPLGVTVTPHGVLAAE